MSGLFVKRKEKKGALEFKGGKPKEILPRAIKGETSSLSFGSSFATVAQKC